MSTTPEDEIAGMAAHHVRGLTAQAMSIFVGMETRGDAYEGLNYNPYILEQHGVFAQLLQDALREAYFRGAAHTIAIAKTEPIQIHVNCGNAEHHNLKFAFKDSEAVAREQ